MTSPIKTGLMAGVAVLVCASSIALAYEFALPEDTALRIHEDTVLVRLTHASAVRLRRSTEKDQSAGPGVLLIPGLILVTNFDL